MLEYARIHAIAGSQVPYDYTASLLIRGSGGKCPTFAQLLARSFRCLL